jgi:hypothetical protein
MTDNAACRMVYDISHFPVCGLSLFTSCLLAYFVSTQPPDRLSRFPPSLLDTGCPSGLYSSSTNHSKGYMSSSCAKHNPPPSAAEVRMSGSIPPLPLHPCLRDVDWGNWMSLTDTTCSSYTRCPRELISASWNDVLSKSTRNTNTLEKLRAARSSVDSPRTRG